MWFLVLVVVGVGIGLSKRPDSSASRLLLAVTLLVSAMYGLSTGAF